LVATAAINEAEGSLKFGQQELMMEVDLAIAFGFDE
jgi:hypothetical protein